MSLLTPDCSRRTALKAVATSICAGLATATGSSCAKTPKHPRKRSLIYRENQRQGTLEWMLRRPMIEEATKYRCPWIEGYTSRTSVGAGETMRIFVSTQPESKFHLDIFRMGFYGGKGARKLRSYADLSAPRQPTPEPGPYRLMDCRWVPVLELTIPEEWVSGVYLGKLTHATSGIDSYIVFIVKDSRRADFLFQCSDNTWQAYNRWPSGFSLYDDGHTPWYWGGGVQVSFNRPYGKYCQILNAPLSCGSGEFLLWEFPMAYWMESMGYDLTYGSNLDTHQDPKRMSRARCFLSVGHDEYWTDAMYENVRLGIRDGLNVGFFSGNAVCGKILYSEDSSRQKDRVFERIGVFGPPAGTREFNSMSSLIHEPPYANALIGAHSTGPVTGGADWICRRPDHWLFKGTGMKSGDRIPGLVGWEWHGDPANIPGLEVVASGKTQTEPGVLNGGEYTATVYYGPQGNAVFNASTIWWGDGLSRPPGYVRPSVYTTPQGPDPRVQQITRNFLEYPINGNEGTP